ncbi:hypothetical protein OX284_013905 [Flavobacterium sp. SUN046]|uniref:hypothetical protein n=1 Tax=Flavobacterium sp. SUN046 TaxID=3002440 RepID=UPI002DB5F5D9|nr:hypothetical protein [Flavobacterium sp. SUN046]MEC4050530.1 hypothetical protein [Flavobacterium sp. SUN046]
MNTEIKSSSNTAGAIRLIGSLIIIVGLIFLALSQLMETTIESKSENIDIETLIQLPKKIADKTNYSLLGGFLIIIGLQMAFVSNQIISDISEQFKKPL